MQQNVLSIPHFFFLFGSFFLDEQLRKAADFVFVSSRAV